jgi:hypothetical protein
MNTIAPISDAAERAKVLEACREFVAARPSQTFVPGRAYVPVTGKVPDATDLLRLVDASLDLLLTAGGSRNCSRQPRELCRYQICLHASAGVPRHRLSRLWHSRGRRQDHERQLLDRRVAAHRPAGTFRNMIEELLS